MTEPLHNVAGEPLPEGVDLLGLGVRALAFSVALGAAAITAVIWAVQSILPSAPAGAPSGAPATGAPFYLLVLGTPAAMGLAAVACWILLRPVQSWFRRGALAMVSGFLSLVVSLLTLPANAIFGRAGLAAATVLFAAAALLGARSLQRWSRAT
ncbi:MAG TPA: hypothetical protein VFS28_03175 [Gemmatimonadales bacterium]|jgi:hypothetical protein|nr:hypothetical protein [Gemmatimonadales bacterium]